MVTEAPNYGVIPPREKSHNRFAGCKTLAMAEFQRSGSAVRFHELEQYFGAVVE